MEKKIEEMIHEMAHCLCGQKNCVECPSDYRCEFITECSILIKKGYRRQTEGEWIKSEDWEYDFNCSVCGNTAHKGNYGNYDDLSKFCPNCGAHMKGE